MNKIIKTLLFTFTAFAMFNVSAEAKVYSVNYGTVSVKEYNTYMKRINSLAGIKKSDQDSKKVKKALEFIRKKTSYRYKCDLHGIMKDLSKGKNVKLNCCGYSNVLYWICAYNGIPTRIKDCNVQNGFHSCNLVFVNNHWQWCDPCWYDCTNGKEYGLTRKLWSNHNTKKVYREYWRVLSPTGINYRFPVAKSNIYRRVIHKDNILKRPLKRPLMGWG